MANTLWMIPTAWAEPTTGTDPDPEIPPEAVTDLIAKGRELLDVKLPCVYVYPSRVPPAVVPVMDCWTPLGP